MPEIIITPDPGPDQTGHIGPKQRALLAIAQIKKQLADIEQVVNSIQEVKAPLGTGTQPGAKKKIASKSKVMGR